MRFDVVDPEPILLLQRAKTTQQFLQLIQRVRSHQIPQVYVLVGRVTRLGYLRLDSDWLIDRGDDEGLFLLLGGFICSWGGCYAGSLDARGLPLFRVWFWECCEVKWYWLVVRKQGVIITWEKRWRIWFLTFQIEENYINRQDTTFHVYTYIMNYK